MMHWLMAVETRSSIDRRIQQLRYPIDWYTLTDEQGQTPVHFAARCAVIDDGEIPTIKFHTSGCPLDSLAIYRSDYSWQSVDVLKQKDNKV